MGRLCFYVTLVQKPYHHGNSNVSEADEEQVHLYDVFARTINIEDELFYATRFYSHDLN